MTTSWGIARGKCPGRGRSRPGEVSARGREGLCRGGAGGRSPEGWEELTRGRSCPRTKSPTRGWTCRQKPEPHPRMLLPGQGKEGPAPGSKSASEDKTGRAAVKPRACTSHSPRQSQPARGGGAPVPTRGRTHGRACPPVVLTRGWGRATNNRHSALACVPPRLLAPGPPGRPRRELPRETIPCAPARDRCTYPGMMLPRDRTPCRRLHLGGWTRGPRDPLPTSRAEWGQATADGPEDSGPHRRACTLSAPPSLIHLTSLTRNHGHRASSRLSLLRCTVWDAS